MASEFTKSYVSGENHDHIQEIIESNDEFMFEYNGNDYFLENIRGIGWIIVEPKSYFASGGYPENPPIAYPMSGKAKTPQELLSLSFLDGKTIFERFEELKFFD